MPTIYLVRHGKAAAGWDADLNPGLDDLGRQQAQNAAKTLAPLGPLELISSPLTRTRETAIPLVELWNQTLRIEARVAEIPSPSENLSERSEWLRRVMADRWTHLDQGLLSWRQGVISAILDLRDDSIVFSHFIAINVIVGEAEGDDRVVNFLPDNASITIIETGETEIRLLEKGIEAGTTVN
jgi:broad specificity phosphatase PhoE